MNSIFRKTRLAPTPSGYLHLGNIYSFAITAALAKHHGARILLRIDDLDQHRSNEVYVNDIFSTLRYMDIPWDEGPRNTNEFYQGWSQTHRVSLYQTALDKLKDKNALFACICSRTQLQQSGLHEDCSDEPAAFNQPHASWRLKTDTLDPIFVHSLTGTNEVVLPDSMQQFVVKTKDGFAAYQIASLIDDLHFNIDLIVRGEDLWSSTIAQHTLASLLNEPGFLHARFHHHSLLQQEDGRKLSKSAGSVSIRHLREQGLSPENIYRQLGIMAGLEKETRHWTDFLPPL